MKKVDFFCDRCGKKLDILTDFNLDNEAAINSIILCYSSGITTKKDCCKTCFEKIKKCVENCLETKENENGL